MNEAIQTEVTDRQPAEDLARNAAEAAAFLKAISHEGRLMILCHIAESEKTVSALETALGVRQAAVSQQLSRLRAEGLVRARRDGKQIHYAIKDPKVLRLIKLVHTLFCAPDLT